MPRVSNMPFEQIDPELQKIMKEYDDELGGSEFVEIFAHSPKTFKNFINFYFPLISETRGGIDPRITELARMMVAEKNDCRLCKAARFAHAQKRGVTEELVQEIPNYRQSKLLTPREKAAIHYAEVLAGDHKKADKALFDELRQHFSEADIIDLGWRIVTFVGYGRFLHVLDLDIGHTCPLSPPKPARAAA
ncbi:MAG: carboxymuconolactone decarboxylase family protein [Nevskia sp.]|nr:carboxymuconolactone decarboxylase family protein [Nevskia sp.]